MQTEVNPIRLGECCRRLAENILVRQTPNLFSFARRLQARDEIHISVTVAGRTGNFLVIGIDSLTKTVEVRTTSASFSASFVVVKDVPWTTSYLD
jgi:hypothetical protein